MSSQEKDIIQSITKIPLVLRLFSSQTKKLTLQEIHVNSGMSKTSAFRLCNSLINIGFLERYYIGNTPYYSLGIELYRYGRLALENLDFHKSARKYLNKISNELDDSCYLFIERENKALCIEKLTGNYYIQTFTTNVGDSLPFNKGGGPLALFSFMSDSKQKEIIESMTLNETDKVSLYDKIKSCKENGYSFSIGEVYKNTAAIGVPVFNINGEVVGALSVGAIESRFSEDRVPIIVNTLKKYASQLSKELGYENNT